MQRASQAYKQSMKQVLRNRSYMRVTIGVINQEAQENAYVSDSEDYTYFSNFTKPLSNYSVDYIYATAEQDYSIVDGGMIFLPRDSENVVLNAGIVSADLLGGIEIGFDTAYDIKGLTIVFGKAYPVNFIIESDNYMVEITGNTLESFITDKVFLQATYIRITPSSMVNGNSRLRIHQMKMGIGVYFDNKKIITSSLKDTISPVSEELPALDFNLTIDNQDQTYNIENDESSINFLETGQEIIVEFGYDIEDNVTEWITGAKLFLKDWSANDIQMKFTAVDRFEYMQNVYYRGRYYSSGISLYDLAIDVLIDAGVDDREYWIDPYLKKVLVYNPLPVCTHKEALQIIANAGRCIITQDREAKIYIKSSFIPDMIALSDNETYFSKTANILKQGTKDVYAIATNNVTAACSDQYFLPKIEIDNYLNTGYISEDISDKNGIFSVNPVIIINLEAAYKCFGLTIMFNGNPPEEFIIHTYLEDNPVEDVSITDISLITLVTREFSEFDKIEIEFTKAPPYNRVMVDYIKIGEVTDYTLERSLDLSKVPTGTKLEKVKELQIIRTMYSQSMELKELVSETVITSTTENEFTFDFSNASYGYTCTLEDVSNGQSAVITESGAYYAKVIFNGFTDETEAAIVITGYEYVTTTAKTVWTLSNTGTVESWNNPLVSTIIHAKDVGEWIGDYLKSDREYDITYRGDPRIDANDILFMENNYIQDMQIKVTGHTLNFNGSLSGTIRGRRVV